MLMAEPIHVNHAVLGLVDTNHEYSESSCPTTGKVQLLLSKGATARCPEHAEQATTVCTPDLYREDGLGAGPRPLTVPVTLDYTQDQNGMSCVDIINVYNKALLLHSQCQFLEAAQLYEVVSLTVQNLAHTPFPSVCLLELGMKSHNNFATIAYAKGDHTASLIGLEAALLFGKQLVDSTAAFKHEYVSVLSNWCNVCWTRGDISPTLYQALGEVLRLRSILFAWDHEDVAAAHYNIAVAEYASNHNDTAAKHLTEYLKIAAHRAKSGKMDLDPIPALTYLLLLQNEDKEDRSSQDLVRGLRALQDKRQEQGSASAEVASVLNFIGTLLFHKSELDHALLFFQEELRLEQQLLECKNDISVSVTCNNIGRILQELGNLEEAVGYYKRALEVEDLIPGQPVMQGDKAYNQSTSNLYSTVWYNLGLIHDKLGNYFEAIEAFGKSLELRKAMLGRDHPDIACLYYNIGVLQMERQHLDEASKSFAEALRIRYHGAGNQLNDDRVIKTLEKLASLYKAKGNIKGATNASREILKILESSTEIDSWKRLRDSALLLRSISELHHAEGSMPLALSAAQKSVDKFGALLSDSSIHEEVKESTMYNILEQLGSSLVLLGSLYHEMSEPIQADFVLNQAVQMLDGAINACDFDMALPSSIYILREVASMLANNHCAPEA